MEHSFLYIVGQLSTGGLERQIGYLTGELQRRGYSPAIVVWNHDEEATYHASIRELGIPILAISETDRRPWKRILALRELVRRLRVEVIHAYSFYLNIAAYLASQGTPAIACGAVRGDFHFDLQVGGFLGPVCAAFPRAQIYNSAAAERAVHDYPFWMRPPQRFVVRNGMEFEQFSHEPMPSGPPWNLVGVGRLEKVKRWDVLLEAARRLKMAGVEFVMTLVGGGAEEIALKEQARALEVADCVRFVGDQRDVRPYLKDAHVVVMTSDSEGVPNALMEAMATGRPVVATDVGDVSWMVDDGTTGYLVPRRDASALAQRLQQLLSRPEMLKSMGRQARTKAEQSYSNVRLADETLAAYTQAGWQRNGRG